MQPKTRKILVIAVSYLLAGILSLGVWALGMLSGLPKGLCAGGWGTSVGLLVAMAAGSILLMSQKSKRAKGLKAQEILDLELKSKEEAEAAPEKWEKKTKRWILAAVVWEAAVIFLCLAGAFFMGGWMGAGKDNSDFMQASILYNLYSIFVLEGYIVTLFGEKGEESFPLALRKEEYPAVYALVEKAARCAGVGKKLRVYIVSGGFSVSESRRFVTVFFNGQIFGIMTDEEVYSVLLHEFAHVRNLDTGKRVQYLRICECVDVSEQSSAWLTALLFGGIAAIAAIERGHGDMYFSRRREILADEFVRQNGLGQAYVNATAKATLYQLYTEESTPECYEQAFSGDEYPADICAIQLSVFEQYLEKKGALWDFILRNELPARVDSHPTFRMRMEHMGREEYDITARETDPEGRKEREKMRHAISDFMRRSDGGQFREMLGVWKEALENKRRFEEAERTGADVSADDLIRWIDSLLGMYDDCVFRMAERLEEKNPGSTLAALYMGEILARRGDENCLTLLYRAAKEPDFSEEAMQQAGVFCLRSGNQALLDDFRARTAPVLQNVMDESAMNEIAPNDKLVVCDIPAELLRPLLQRIVQAGGGYVRRIWAALRRKEGKNDVYVYLIRFCRVPVFRKKQETRKGIAEAQARIYACLMESGLPEAFRRFFMISDESSPLATLVRRRGKAVYDSSLGILL